MAINTFNDVMNATVVTARSASTFAEVIMLMIKKSVGSVIVEDPGQSKGV